MKYSSIKKEKPQNQKVIKYCRKFFDRKAEKFNDMILTLMTILWLKFWMYESFI